MIDVLFIYWIWHMPTLISSVNFVITSFRPAWPNLSPLWAKTWFVFSRNHSQHWAMNRSTLRKVPRSLLFVLCWTVSSRSKPIHYNWLFLVKFNSNRRWSISFWRRALTFPCYQASIRRSSIYFLVFLRFSTSAKIVNEWCSPRKLAHWPPRSVPVSHRWKNSMKRSSSTVSSIFWSIHWNSWWFDPLLVSTLHWPPVLIERYFKRLTRAVAMHFSESNSAKHHQPKIPIEHFSVRSWKMNSFMITGQRPVKSTTAQRCFNYSISSVDCPTV